MTSTSFIIGHRIEEVHADDLVGTLGVRGELGDGDRGSVAGENDFRAADVVEVAERFAT